MIEETFTKELPIPVSDEILAKHAKEMANEMGRLEELEREKKEFVSNINADIQETLDRAKAAGRVVRHSAVFEEVACIERRNEENETIETIRLDNNEMVDERPMTEEDRQLPLPSGDDEAGAEDPNAGVLVDDEAGEDIQL